MDNWLGWKIKHGLANRGRTGRPLAPKGLLARMLYKIYYHKHDVAPAEQRPDGSRLFKQNVGGTLGPSGEVNK